LWASGRQASVTCRGNAALTQSSEMDASRPRERAAIYPFFAPGLHAPGRAGEKNLGRQS
jgi:hypothetical protein